MKITFRTPITYYGGKQKLLPFILPRIPAHKSYNEIFAGGAAVFFAKPPSEIEVLNDINNEMINFYKVVQNNFSDLEREIKSTLHSRSLHKQAWVTYTNPQMFTEVKRAWAVWVLSTQSYSSKLNGAWGYDKTKNQTSKKIQSKKEDFVKELAIRLQNVQLECTDALYILNSRDHKDAFFYVDPPYVGTDCGHYNGYTLQDYENLLKVLSKIKGKFLLSSYPSETLMEHSKRNKWNMFSVEQRVSVDARRGYLKRKVEVLTANYKI